MTGMDANPEWDVAWLRAYNQHLDDGHPNDEAEDMALADAGAERARDGETP